MISFESFSSSNGPSLLSNRVSKLENLPNDKLDSVIEEDDK